MTDQCPVSDRFITIADAAKSLSTTPAKIKKLIAADMLIWEQPKNSRKIYVEVSSLMRLKYPEHLPSFKGLHVSDPVALQKEIDAARHKIGYAASLPPGAIKIIFDIDGK